MKPKGKTYIFTDNERKKPVCLCSFVMNSFPLPEMYSIAKEAELSPFLNMKLKTID